LEVAPLKHLSRWHKTNTDEELMKASAFIAALIAHEASDDAAMDQGKPNLKDAEKIGTLWRTTSGRLQIQLSEKG